MKASAERLAFLRRLTLAGLASVGLLTLVRLAFVDGWQRRITIEGASMAPAFQGAHYAARCASCGCEYEFVANEPPGRGETVCPNCSSRRPPVAITAQAGDRVLIDRWPLLWRDPERWETVAATLGAEFMIKRVVALPGETLELRGGDVWVNQRPAERPGEVESQQSYLVHDDRRRSSSDRLRRWIAGPGWTETGDGYRFTPPAKAGAFEYAHARVDFRPNGVTEPSAILDDDPYNLHANRRLHEVRDIALACQLTAAQEANFTFGLHDGAAWCWAKWSAAETRWRLSREEVALDQRSADALPADARIEFSRCDGRLRLTVNGLVVVEARLPPTADDCEYSQRPLRIEAADGEIHVRDLVVRRDVFYLDPDDRGGDWRAPRALAPAEFALLGDNAPASVDSRRFAEYGVRRERLLGVVIPWSRRPPP